MSKDITKGAEDQTGAAPEKPYSMTPRPEIDLHAYVDDLGDLDISEAQKIEFLGVLASVMWHFVDLGFHVDTLDLLIPVDEPGTVDSLKEGFDKISPMNGGEEGPA